MRTESSGPGDSETMWTGSRSGHYLMSGPGLREGVGDGSEMSDCSSLEEPVGGAR